MQVKDNQSKITNPNVLHSNTNIPIDKFLAYSASASFCIFSSASSVAEESTEETASDSLIQTRKQCKNA